MIHSPPHELVSSWTQNFRNFVERVEQHGPSVSAQKEKVAVASTSSVVVVEEEALDATLLSKLSAGMALANLQIEDLHAALRCIDFGLMHATNSQRRGGLLAMRAGVLNRLKRYDEASRAALLSVEASDNLQGYLQGAAAYRLQRKDDELKLFLERAQQSHPSDVDITKQLEVVNKEGKLSLSE